MKVKEYCDVYGDNWAEDGRKLFLKTKHAHRRGVKFSKEHVEKLKEAFKIREEKYQAGKLTRPEYIYSEERIKKQVEETKKWAKEHPEESSAHVKKAQVTRKAAGPGNKLNSKSSDETKKKISDGNKLRHVKTKIDTVTRFQENLLLSNITITNRDDDVFFCKCNICNYEFNRCAITLRQGQNKIDYCPKCFPKNINQSKAEKEIADYIISLGINIETRDREIVKPLELDIYIPSHNLAIEYNGLYWHSEFNGGKNNSYHKTKFERCFNKNVKLLTIFEDEWSNKQDLIKSMIRSNLVLLTDKIYARKCSINKITSKEAKIFLEENHIHGYARSELKYGLFYDNRLVYVMTFIKSNISRGNKDMWEIQRMAGIKNTKVTGAASKLFFHFIKEINPISVLSYADLRWFTGDSYKNMGFKFINNTTAGYWYFKLTGTNRYHRYSLRKNKDDDRNLTEWENRQLQGYDRIWDCGHAKWIWTNKDKNGA
jgi:hypothetical protein